MPGFKTPTSLSKRILPRHGPGRGTTERTCKRVKRSAPNLCSRHPGRGGGKGVLGRQGGDEVAEEVGLASAGTSGEDVSAGHHRTHDRLLFGGELDGVQRPTGLRFQCIIIVTDGLRARVWRISSILFSLRSQSDCGIRR